MSKIEKEFIQRTEVGAGFHRPSREPFCRWKDSSASSEPQLTLLILQLQDYAGSMIRKPASYMVSLFRKP